jgi:hypothetical protein
MSKRSTQAIGHTLGAVACETQTHFRIMQKARAEAIEARREAINAFWDGVGALLRRAANHICSLAKRGMHLRSTHA